MWQMFLDAAAGIIRWSMIKTKTGKSISVEDYVEQMKDNLLYARDIFERTPICKKTNGDFFWWDEEKNPVLDKQSVRDMIKDIKGML